MRARLAAAICWRRQAPPQMGSRGANTTQQVGDACNYDSLVLFVGCCHCSKSVTAAMQPPQCGVRWLTKSPAAAAACLFNGCTQALPMSDAVPAHFVGRPLHALPKLTDLAAVWGRAEQATAAAQAWCLSLQAAPPLQCSWPRPKSSRRTTHALPFMHSLVLP